MWQIQATVTRTWIEHEVESTAVCFSTRQIPTFFLDEDIQGILTAEGAMKIALQIIDPFEMYEVSGIAVKL